MVETTDEEPLTPAQKKFTRKELLKLGLLGAGSLVAVELATLPRVNAYTDSSAGRQFPATTSDGSNPGDWFFFVRSDESVHGRLRYWQGGTAYDVLNNIVNADIGSAAAIANSKVVGLANLASNAFATYPLTSGTDFLPPWGTYDYYIRVITGSPNSYQAYDNQGNKFGSSSTDAAVVINAVLTQILVTANISGSIWCQNGLYNINSLTKDTNASAAAYSYSNSGAIGFYYGLGIPIGSLQRDITIVGESADDVEYIHGAGPTHDIPTGGVIFNITSTAMNSIAAANNVCGLWHLMPSNTNIAGNSIHIYRTRVRFPSNQLSSYTGHVPAGIMQYSMEFCQDYDVQWNYADFNIALDSLSPATASGSGIPNVGFYSMKSEHHLTTSKRNQATGTYLGFEYEAESMRSEQDTANLCTYPFVKSIKYVDNNFESTIDQFYEFQCINGPILGQTAGDSSIYMPNYTKEYTNSGAFAVVNGATESTPSSWQGLVRFKPILSASGHTNTEFFKAGNGGYVQNFDVEQSPQGISGTTYQMLRSNLFLSVDSSSNVVAVTLPACSDVGEQGQYVVVHIAGANAVTVVPKGSDTIEGSASAKTITTAYAKVVLQSRGTTDWYDLTHGGI